MTQSLHGWLILDKPLHISSAQAVGAVKRLLKPKKIGHGGTLDPLASGILPLALGEATKTFEYVVSHEKEYRFTVTWGESRSTDDAEGEAINQSEKRPTEAEILAILPQFTGIIQQRPPIFSAISQGGKRAYAMARAGQEVVLEPRPVEVMQLEYLGSEFDTEENPPKGWRVAAGVWGGKPPIARSAFKITCGKGTYIRSIARDMGEILGCFGYVSALRRTRVGRFDEKSAISLDDLKNLDYTQQPTLPLVKMHHVLDDILGVILTPDQAARLRQGQALALASLPPQLWQEGQVIRCHQPGVENIIAMARVEAESLKPVKVFNL